MWFLLWIQDGSESLNLATTPDDKVYGFLAVGDDIVRVLRVKLDADLSTLLEGLATGGDS